LTVWKPLISPGSKSVNKKILKKIGVEEQKTNFTIFRPYTMPVTTGM